MGQVCWAEIWHIIEPMLESVLTKGEATWFEDSLFLLERNGYLEECYFTFSHSPILDETGSVGGIFTVVTETTKHVLSERRLKTLRAIQIGSSKSSLICCSMPSSSPPPEDE